MSFSASFNSDLIPKRGDRTSLQFLFDVAETAIRNCIATGQKYCALEKPASISLEDWETLGNSLERAFPSRVSSSHNYDARRIQVDLQILLF